MAVVSTAATFTFPVQAEQALTGGTSGISGAQVDDGFVEILTEADAAADVTAGPSAQVLTLASVIGGTFPADVQTENGVYVQYREANAAVNEIGAIGYKSGSGGGVNFPKQLDWTGSAWGTPETELATAGGAVRSVRTVWNASDRATDFYIAVEASAVITVYRCTNVDTCSSEETVTTQATGTPPERHWDMAVEQLSNDVLLLYDNPTAVANDFCYKTRSANTGLWSSETCFNHASIATTNPSIAYIALASNPGTDRIALGAADTTNDYIVLGMWDGSAWLTGAHQATLTTAYTPTAGLGVGVYAEDSADEFVAYGSNGADSVRECEWTFASGWEATTACLSFDPENTPVEVDATSSGSVTGAVSSITVSHTTGTGSNRLMLVGITITNDGAPVAGPRRVINSVTFGGTGLTEVATVYIDDDARVSIYRLLSPAASTTANVVATLDANIASIGGITMGVITFSGVDQTTPLGTPVTEAEGDGSITVPAANNELIFDTIATEDATALSAGADQAQRWALRPNAEVGGGGSTQPGTADDTMSWAHGSSNHRAHAGVNIRSAGANTKAFTEGGWREGSNSVLICASNDEAILACWEWSGIAGTGGTREGLLEATTDDGSGPTVGLPGDVDWNPDQSGTADGFLVYYANSPGSLSYRTYDDGANAFGSPGSFPSSGTHLWVEVVGTERSGDAVKAHACASNSNFDVLCYRWTGSGAPGSEQSITADTGDETYRYWSLALQETPADYRMDVQYDWVGVASGDSYVLSVKGYRQDEDIFVQVLTPPSTWNTRITISATSNTIHTYAPMSQEIGSGGLSIRFVDPSGVDASASDWFLDWAAVTTVNLQYTLEVRQDITGIVAASSAALVVKGNISAGGENYDIHAWNFTSAGWDVLLARPFSAASAYHNVSLTASHLSAGTVRVRFVDAALQDAVRWALSLDFVAVVATNVAPALANGGVSPSSGTLATSFAFYVTYVDAENDPPSFVNLTLDGVSYAMTANNTADTTYTDGKGYFLNLMIASRGTFSYSFTTRASTGDVAIASVPIRQVSVSNRGPTITTAITILTSYRSSPFAYAFDAIDPDLDPVSWSVRTNATFLSIGVGNGTLSGVTSNVPATYWVEVTADDGFGGAGRLTFTLAVVNRAPQLLVNASETGRENELYEASFSAIDPDLDPVAWSLVTNATWLTLDPANARVTGMALPGVYYVNLTASDPYGGGASRNFTIRIAGVSNIPDRDDGLGGFLFLFIVIAAALGVLIGAVFLPRRRQLVDQAFLIDQDGEVRFHYATPGAPFDEARLWAHLQGQAWRDMPSIPVPPYTLHIVRREGLHWVIVSKSPEAARVIKAAEKLFLAAQMDLEAIGAQIPAPEINTGET